MSLPLLLRNRPGAQQPDDDGGASSSTCLLDRMTWFADDGSSWQWPYMPQGVEGRGAPPVELISMALPGDGAAFQRSRFNPRVLFLPIAFTDLPQQLRVKVRSWIRAVAGSREGGTLRVASVAGDVREIHAHYTGGAELVEDWSQFQKMILQLTAFDPFWLDVNDQLLTWSAGAREPFFPIPKPPSGPYIRLAGNVIGSQTIVNDGDAEAWPVWTIEGPAVEPVPGETSIAIVNHGTGESIQLARGLAAGEVVVVDTRPGAKTITDQTGANLWDVVLPGSQLFPLRRGANLVEVRIESAEVGTRVNARWRRQWLSA